MLFTNKILLPLYMAIIWSFANIYKSYVAINYQVNATAFSIIALFSASIILISYGRTNNSVVKKSFKEKHSWSFAIFDILSNITLMIMFYYASSTRSSYLCQLCSVTAIIHSLISNKRKIKAIDMISSLLILSGTFYTLAEIKSEYVNIVASCTILSAIFMTAKTLSAENNPLNMSFMDNRARMKVTGIVVSLSSFFMALLFTTIKIFTPYINTKNSAINYIVNNMPNINDFTNLSTIISGVIYGIVLIASARFVYFKASKIASTETLLIVTSISPLITLILEYLSFKLGIFDNLSINIYDLYICILITIGVVLLTISRNKTLLSSHDKKIRDIFHKKKAS